MCEFEDEIPEGTRKVLEQMRTNNNIITVHCPHLDDSLQPVPELVDITTCPKGLSGKCSAC